MKLRNSQVMFGALADRTRFRILCLLTEGELCVCDIMRVLKEPQSKVSRHLSYLRKSGLVTARKDGLWMYYRLAPQNTGIFRAVFGALHSARSDFKELEKDISEFRKTKKTLVSCCQ